jgi:ABC-2 type transport system ATP-binding protein
MTDRPHALTLRSSDNRRLAAGLMNEPSVFGVSIDGERLVVQSSDLTSFARAAPRVAQDMQVSLFEIAATDQSLESVFSYLVKR